MGLWFRALLLALLLAWMILLTAKAYGQVDCVKWVNADNSAAGTYCAPFAIKAGSNITLSKSGTTMTIAATGSLGVGFDSISGATNTTAAMIIGTGASINFSGTGTVNASHVKGTKFNNAESLGKIPIGQGDGSATWSDPLVQGTTAEGAAIPNPVVIGGKDGSGNNLALVLDSSGRPTVNVNGSVGVTGPLTDTQLRAVAVPVSLPSATVTTLTPPAAITNFANETGGNLAAIKADVDKIPALGQALAAGSVPVILPAATITTLTPPAAITNFANETGGNLATIAGAVSATKMKTSAADGDVFVRCNSGTTCPVNATLSAETSKVIGTVNVAASQTIAVTNTGTFAVQAASTLGAETTKVIGTVRNLGNAGAIFDGPTGSAVPANAVAIGVSDGTNTRIPVMDPCGYLAWTYYYVSVAANTQIAVAAGTGKNYYICQMAILPVAAAATINLVSSATAGNACATSTTAFLTGGTTAATGASVAINGGFILPATGHAWAVTQATNHAFCIFASAAVTGVVAYVTQ